MKYLATLLLIFGFGISGFGQTIKSLGYNTTNGQVVANTGTNALTFTNTNITVNNISVGGDSANGTIKSESSSSSIDFINGELSGEWKFIYTNGVNFEGPLYFVGANSNSAANSTRANLGFSTNLNTLWTATNTALGRTALGISSANKRTATAFAAEFYDDFSAYPDGTLVTNGFRPVYGPAYSLIYYAATNASPLAPTVTNGMLRPSGTNNPPDGNETYYLTSVLPSNVRSFGADVKWVTNANIDYSSVVFLIRTNNAFLGSFLHIPVSFTNTSIQWSTNGAGGLNTVTNFTYTNLTRGQTIRILGSIRSNVLTMNIGGNIVKATNNFFESLAGRWFTFEQYGYGLYGITDLAEVERVWANAAWQDAMTPNGTWDIYNPAGLRTNLGLGWSALTNTNSDSFRSAIGLGESNSVVFNQVIVQEGDLTTGLFGGGGLSFESDGTNIPSEIILFSGDEAELLRSRARTNLGLGGGITTNRTFVSYNGTNYTTNTVTISNGIITGWTQ